MSRSDTKTPRSGQSQVQTQPSDDVAKGTLRGRPFRVVRALLLALLRLILGLRVEGLEHVPASGGVLVVSNHLHNADPVLASIAMPRPLHFMAKAELFKIPVIGWIIRGVGAFPVARGKSDRNAIRRAEATLAQGIAVGMFPEGTRSLTHTMTAGLPGAGLIALRSGVPILPMAVTGTERLPGNGSRANGAKPTRRKRGIVIRFGPPLTIPREENGQRITSDEATTRMMIAIARLLPPEYRGVYADSVESA